MLSYLHRRTGAVWAVPLLGLFAVGGCKCGPGGTNAPDGQNLGPYLDVLGAVCSYISRCPNQTPYTIAYRSQSECVNILEFLTSCRLTSSQDSSGNTQLGVQQSFPNVDQAQAQACIDWLNAAACGAPFSCDGGAGCNSPCDFLGGTNSGSTQQLPGLDQTCANSSCAPGFYCEGAQSLDGGGTTCQVCKPLRALGEDCIDPPYVACGPGLFCPSDGGGCVATYPAGQGCNWGGQCASSFCNPRTSQCDAAGNPGDPCTTAQDCRQGFCDSSSHCRNSLPSGAACTASTQCQDGYCDTGSQLCGRVNGTNCSSDSDCQGYCNTSASPSVCATKLSNGSTCQYSTQCQSAWCDIFGTRTCIADGCNTDADCSAGHYCDFSSQRCVAVGANGAGCQMDSQCQSGHCNLSSQVCAAPPTLGGTCSGYGDCLPIGYCNNGTCAAFLKPDSACTDIESCAPPFVCLKSKCTLMPLTCAPAPAGSTCTYLSVCDQNSYCDPLNNFTCDARSGAGAACVRPDQCQPGLFCDLTSQKCAADGQLGAACGFEQPCTTGLYCDSTSNQCSAPKAAGATCSPNQSQECASGSCSYNGSGYVCLAACTPPPPGEVPACHPKACPATQLCGTFDDGCGRQLDCGNCSAPQSCGGGGTPGMCGCTPNNSCQARECGVIDNGCGQQIQCDAGCGSGQTCGGGGWTGLCGCATDTTTPFTTPTSGTDVGRDGGFFYTWRTPQNALAGADSGAVATVQINFAHGSDFLVGTGYGFQVPASATVNQIQVSFQASVADVFGNYASADFDQVVLMSGGKMLETDHPSTYLSGTPQSVVLQLGNAPWQPAQINSPDFSVGLSFSTNYSDAVVAINDLQVSILYDHDCSACHPVCQPTWQCGNDGCGGQCNGGCAAGWSCNGTTCYPQLWTDPSSGLTWQNTLYPSFLACQASDAGGFTDWHAPTIDQMRTLIVGCPSSEPDGGCGVTDSCNTAACATAACNGCAYGGGPGPLGTYLPNEISPVFRQGYLSSTTSAPGGYWVTDYLSTWITQGSDSLNACVRP